MVVLLHLGVEACGAFCALVDFVRVFMGDEVLFTQRFVTAYVAVVLFVGCGCVLYDMI